MPDAIRHLSLFQPLRHARFRQLWLANLLSNLGAWIQAFAAAWHVAALSESATLTSLLQTATWAPMLLFALPAGALADAMHQPKLLFRSNAAMGLTALALGCCTIAGTHSAPLILALTFVMGIGKAYTMPAWQASMTALVTKDEVKAVASLANLSFNAAALAGPFLGGLLFRFSGPAPLYMFNAASFCGLLWCYRRWQADEAGEASRMQQRPRPANGLLAGVTASWQSSRYRHLLIHAALIFCATTAFAALLPSLVHDVLHADAREFGALMGALGGGAILASALLPAMRRRLSQRALLAAALLIFGAMMGLLGLTGSLMARLLLIGCGGIAWSVIVTSLNGAAFGAFPSSVRARTLSIYMLMIAAGQTAGGALWGQLAIRYGVVAVMTGAGVSVMLSAIAILASADFLE